MIFNSYIFIFIFLPITFCVYFLLSKRYFTRTSRIWLVFSSLFFYSWWNIAYLPIILFSMFFNYLVATRLNNWSFQQKRRKLLLVFGIFINLALLAYYKYADFLIDNLNYVTDSQIERLHLLLPLAISFFTFQQIAYLVDSYNFKTVHNGFLNYAVFVSFFPQLIAGPIVHHTEMMKQFNDKKNYLLNYRHVLVGVYIFAIGLFKKVIIADGLATWANYGFESSETLTFYDAWVTSLSYTFQLYFDFSGYTDMAIGLALMFNIKLPQNFNSPYQSKNIRDFWRRWHMTLSRFLKNYVYVPMGGSRCGDIRTYGNLIATFVIGGLWHGASWMFVIWGLLHGVALVLHRVWSGLGFRMYEWLAWLVTFNFINVTWVFFRAENISVASNILTRMFLIEETMIFPELSTYSKMPASQLVIPIIVFLGLILSVKSRNSNELMIEFQVTKQRILFIAFCLFLSVININKDSPFLYFNF